MRQANNKHGLLHDAADLLQPANTQTMQQMVSHYITTASNNNNSFYVKTKNISLETTK